MNYFITLLSALNFFIAKTPRKASTTDDLMSCAAIFACIPATYHQCVDGIIHIEYSLMLFSLSEIRSYMSGNDFVCQ